MDFNVGFSLFDEEEPNIVWRDILFGIILIFFLILGVAVLAIHDPVIEKKADDEGRPPGDVIVELIWPNERNIDLDLWVYAPGEPKAVGYSNVNGKFFNLLRDDLGSIGDVTNMNYENAYTRGIPAGEYIVNVHNFRHDSGPPVPVKIVFSIKKDGAGGKGTVQKQLAVGEAELTQGDERTLLRLQLDKNAEIVPGSLNNIFKPLRNVSATTGASP